MSTPHNQAKKEDIAKVVLMPGDPLRAKFVAENYLQNAKLVNFVRNMYAYTGEYKGKKVTIMAHGMGIPSVGIYSYELFKFYDVDYIIRFGTAGGYKENIKVGDVIIAKSSFSESRYAIDLGIKDAPKILYPSKLLLDKAIESASSLNIKYHLSQVASEDVFYNCYTLEQNIARTQNSDAVEMEAYALYANAQLLNKHALTILTCSDSMVTGEQMTSQQRQTSTKNMIELVLDIAIRLE
ncbi:MAG: purine-nucleoside phosphorylase [Mycoplasmoidaceae bacterium]|nr:purine-nucleoside phosphorylase [Mycoplasmoidaceae bacterium]